MVDKHVAAREWQRWVVCCWTSVGGLVGRASTTCSRPAYPPRQKAVQACVRVVVDPCYRISHACFLYSPMHCRTPAHGISWVLYIRLRLQEADAVAGHCMAACKVNTQLHALHALHIHPCCCSCNASTSCLHCPAMLGAAACASAAAVLKLTEPYVPSYARIASQQQHTTEKEQGCPRPWPRGVLCGATRRTQAHPRQSTVGPSHAPAHNMISALLSMFAWWGKSAATATDQS